MGIKPILLIAVLAMGAGDSPSRPAAIDKGRVEDGNRVIVRMVGRGKTLTVFSGARGLTYSVADGAGKMLMNGGTLEELRVKHPELWRQVNSGVAVNEGGTRGELIDASISLDAGF